MEIGTSRTTGGLENGEFGGLDANWDCGLEVLNATVACGRSTGH